MQYLVEIVEGLIAARADVHLDALDQRIEGTARKVEAGDQWRQRLALAGGRLAAFETRRNFALPHRYLRRLRPRRRLVHRIVHGTAEVPHGDDRRALLRREDEE